MIPKFQCDHCKEPLKEKLEDGTIFIISDNVDGLSVMEHHNCNNKVVFCEECYDDYREELKSNEQWMDLDMLDNHTWVQDYFQNYDKLVTDIKRLAEL